MSENIQANFEPKVIAFACEYCAYTAADLAGSMRLQYPTNVRIIQLPCTGRADPILLLRALEEGADTVFVAGCQPGDCHFIKGNYRAKAMVPSVKKMLEEIGLNPQRVEFFHVAASQAPRWVEVVKEMTERARTLGPNPLRVGGGVEYPLASMDKKENLSDKKTGGEGNKP